MRTDSHYIGGKWLVGKGENISVVNPSNEAEITRIPRGTVEEVHQAVNSAKKALPIFQQTSVDQRINILNKIIQGFEKNKDALCDAISTEMGAPIKAAKNVQWASGPAHIKEMIKVLKSYEAHKQNGSTMLVKEPIGVCALITPWNFPINQVIIKIIPALAAGCTMVLKPSEISPLSALLIAKIMDESGAPAGVFNLVNGDKSTGSLLVAHPDVRLVSFTGSTRAGIEIAETAASTIKRVTQELGGKSANILLPDVDIEAAVSNGVRRCFNNSGQSCISPTRMIVPKARLDEVIVYARKTAEGMITGPASNESTELGPVANSVQFRKVQDYIRTGISEGANLVTGGMDRPDDLSCGFYIKPTIFSQVTSEMVIAKEEIFGPVLSILTYSDENEAVAIANDTPYGLAAYIQSKDLNKARAIAHKMEAGVVQINYPSVDRGAPFGGYKQSGNGREWGEHGLNEYLELKAIIGHGN